MMSESSPETIGRLSPAPVVIPIEPVPDVWEALQAVKSLHSVIVLESALQREGVGRYSFLTADPVDAIEHPTVTYGADPFIELRSALASFRVETHASLPPFQGGTAGLLSYELGAAWERLPRPSVDEFQIPWLSAGVYDWVLAWDHAQGAAWLICQGYPETEPSKRLAAAERRAGQILTMLGNADSSGTGLAESTPICQSVTPGVPQFAAPGLPGLTSNFSYEGYLQAISRVIEYIRAGDIFQANLSQRLLLPQPADALELYRRLRSRNPAPFAGYYARDDWAIVSASPERFVRVDKGEVETRPIKGTRSRAVGPEADLFSRDALRESAKDQAENVMIVDLLRNDLSRVCQYGTVRVPQLCRVETYATVQHLVSEIRGLLSAGHDFWDLLAATFPGGSITGAPKIRAMEIIAELESVCRGPYCGSLFYDSFDGHADSSILIRTLTVRHGWVQCSVGGGIVAQSNPEDEYQETLTKAQGMLRALRSS